MAAFVIWTQAVTLLGTLTMKMLQLRALITHHPVMAVLAHSQPAILLGMPTFPRPP